MAVSTGSTGWQGHLLWKKLKLSQLIFILLLLLSSQPVASNDTSQCFGVVCQGVMRDIFKKGQNFFLGLKRDIYQYGLHFPINTFKLDLYADSNMNCNFFIDFPQSQDITGSSHPAAKE